MSEEVTSKLGGYQQVVDGIIERGDRVTYTARGERQIDDVIHAPGIIGMRVEDVEDLFQLRVYRKIPVAKQGGLDHKFPEEPFCQQSGGGGAGYYHPIAQEPEHFIPQDSQVRKDAPMYRGLIGYFPAALFEVAAHSMEADKKHNPGSIEGPTWARGKSPDHLDCVIRHACEVGPRGSKGRVKQLRAVAWRALAALQEECEYLGACPGVSSRF